MKNKIKTVVLTSLIISMSLCACSKQDTQTENSGYVSKFEVDSSTIKNDDIWNTYSIQTSEYEDTNTDVVDPSVLVGEIEIENKDNTTYYTLEGNNIVYGNTTYTDLNSNLDKIDLPCDKNTFINFIVKTFDTDSNTVNTYCSNDNEEVEVAENGEMSTSISLDNGLSDSDEYIKIKQKYGGEPITWSLTLIDIENNTEGVIYGCSKYLMYNGSSEYKQVDMSEYSDNNSNSSNNSIEVTPASENTEENPITQQPNVDEASESQSNNQDTENQQDTERQDTEDAE